MAVTDAEVDALVTEVLASRAKLDASGIKRVIYAVLPAIEAAAWELYDAGHHDAGDDMFQQRDAIAHIAKRYAERA